MNMAKQNTCDLMIKDKITSQQGDWVLARNSKTCLQDSLLDAIWRSRMKNMRTGIKMSPWPYKTQWPYKTLTGPIATSEIMIHYALSKLTKRSGKLF